MGKRQSYYLGKNEYRSLRELCKAKSLAPYDCVRKRIAAGENYKTAISRPAHEESLTQKLDVIYLYLTNKYTYTEISQLLKTSPRRVRDIINTYIQ